MRGLFLEFCRSGEPCFSFLADEERCPSESDVLGDFRPEEEDFSLWEESFSPESLRRWSGDRGDFREDPDLSSVLSEVLLLVEEEGSSLPRWCGFGEDSFFRSSPLLGAVSYTHLTLPTKA